MVTGAYFPELSGGGLQARGIVRALADRAEFVVLSTSIVPALPAASCEEGVAIYRVHVDPASGASALRAALLFFWRFVQLRHRFDVVNLHGFSRKAILLRLLARIFRKPFVLTLQTGGHDEPASVQRLGRAATWAYRGADLYLSVSPGLSRAYLAGGLAPGRLRQVCNAVDVSRFCPADAAERRRLRQLLHLPVEQQLILFVGYFSADKRPHLLFEAWRALPESTRGGSGLVFVGATRGSYAEIDPELASRVRGAAAAAGLGDRIHFVESTLEIERYFRACDVYALPSVREGLPIALLEAMAAGLPCVATRIPGSTDVLIRDGETGVLVAADDTAALTRALDRLLNDTSEALRIGGEARRHIVSTYSIEKTAPMWLDAYRSLMAAAV